jgi:hypothetical protein
MDAKRTKAEMKHQWSHGLGRHHAVEVEFLPNDSTDMRNLGVSICTKHHAHHGGLFIYVYLWHRKIEVSFFTGRHWCDIHHCYFDESIHPYHNPDALEDYAEVSDFMQDFLSESRIKQMALNTLLKSWNISYAVIGGMAVIHHGYIRTTDDIDILVDQQDKDKMKSIPTEKLMVLFSEAISDDGVHGLVFPPPSDISEVEDGLPFINLNKLLEFKISSGIYGKRMQDFGDVQKLIKANQLPGDYGDDFRDDLRAKYLEIWNWSQDEREM